MVYGHFPIRYFVILCITKNSFETFDFTMWIAKNMIFETLKYILYQVILGKQ